MGTENMEEESSGDHPREAFRSWIIVFSLGITMVVWGLLIFYTVGDKGQPPWDFSVIEDVPGESVYSTNTPKSLYGPFSRPMDILLEKQHIKGPETRSKKLSEEGSP